MTLLELLETIFTQQTTSHGLGAGHDAIEWS